MSLRDKLLRAAIRFLREVHHCQNFQVSFDHPSPKWSFSQPDPIGKEKVLPDLVCSQKESTLVLDIADTEEYIFSPKIEELWQILYHFVSQQEKYYFAILTYRLFGREWGEAMLRKRLYQIFQDKAKEISILTFHRGGIGGDLSFLQEEAIDILDGD